MRAGNPRTNASLGAGTAPLEGLLSHLLVCETFCSGLRWINIFQVVSTMVLPTNKNQGQVTELISKPKRKGRRTVQERRKRRNLEAI